MMRKILISALVILAVAQAHGDEQLFDKSMETTYQLIKKVDPELWSVAQQWKSYFQKEKVSRNTKKPTFFYFFTVGKDGETMDSGLSHFSALSYKLKKSNPEINFIAVLRGLPENTVRTSKLFMSEAKDGNGTKAGIVVKYFSWLYDDLKIDRVPAYAFAQCKKEIIDGKDCDFKYIARGAIGLDGFVDAIADNNNTIKKWGATLRDAE